jgi:hypothetical protein
MPAYPVTATGSLTIRKRSAGKDMTAIEGPDERIHKAQHTGIGASGVARKQGKREDSLQAEGRPRRRHGDEAQDAEDEEGTQEQTLPALETSDLDERHVVLFGFLRDKTPKINPQDAVPKAPSKPSPAVEKTQYVSQQQRRKEKKK